MTTELNTYKQLVSQLITEKDTPDTLAALQQEAGQLPDLISSGIFQLSGDYQIKNHICLAQHILVTQADHLYRYLRNTPRIAAKKALILTLDLLKTLGERFPEHGDSINPLPKALVDKLAIAYQRQLEKISRHMTRYGIPAELAEITLYPVHLFLSARYPARYCDHVYLKKYLEILRQLNFRGKDPEAAATLLCSRLVTVNYNGLAFLDYKTSRLLAAIKAAPGKKRKLEVLRKMRSQYKSITVIKGYAFDKNFIPLKDSLAAWIDGEEEKVQLMKETATAPPVTAKELAKIETSAGVLALMARLCKIKGLCQERGQAQIVEHMVSTYTSKRVPAITRTSFKNLFKKPSVPVARALRRILNAMVAEIDFFLANGRLSDQSEKPPQVV
jgi:hypothetical protein